MTTTATPTSPMTNTDDWNAQFAALKSRFPKAKDSIIFCVHALQLSPDIAVDDLKAQADLHGIRVTGASVTAARRLMAPASALATDAVPADEAPAAGAAEKPRRGRRPRAAGTPLDVESLIRSTVERIQGQGATEAERLKVAIQKAIELLQAAATV